MLTKQLVKIKLRGRVDYKDNAKCTLNGSYSIADKLEKSRNTKAVQNQRGRRRNNNNKNNKENYTGWRMGENKKGNRTEEAKSHLYKWNLPTIPMIDRKNNAGRWD